MRSVNDVASEHTGYGRAVAVRLSVHAHVLVETRVTKAVLYVISGIKLIIRYVVLLYSFEKPNTSHTQRCKLLELSS